MDNTKVVKILELLEKDSSFTDEEKSESLIGEKGPRMSPRK